MTSKQYHLSQAGSNKTLNYSCCETTQRFPHVNKFTQERNQMCSSLSILYTFVEFTLMCSCHDCTKDRLLSDNLTSLEAEVPQRLAPEPPFTNPRSLVSSWSSSV